MYKIDFHEEECKKCNEVYAKVDEEDACPFCKLQKQIKKNREMGIIK